MIPAEERSVLLSGCGPRESSACISKPHRETLCDNPYLRARLHRDFFSDVEFAGAARPRSRHSATSASERGPEKADLSAWLALLGGCAARRHAAFWAQGAGSTSGRPCGTAEPRANGPLWAACTPALPSQSGAQPTSSAACLAQEPEVGHANRSWRFRRPRARGPPGSCATLPSPLVCVGLF